MALPIIPLGVDHLIDAFTNFSKSWSLSWRNTTECKMTCRIRHSNLKSLFPHRLCHLLLITIYVLRSHCQNPARNTDVTAAKSTQIVILNIPCKMQIRFITPTLQALKCKRNRYTIKKCRNMMQTVHLLCSHLSACKMGLIIEPTQMFRW
jgi:hypothetical protein